MKTKIQNLLIMSVLCLLPAISSAADKNVKQSEFDPHWFIQLNGGAAYTVGETTFGNLISPAASFNFGYRFTPVWSLRAGVGGWQGKAAAVYYDNPYKFQYLSAGVDVLIDIVNIFADYKASRAVSPYLFAGAGAGFGINNSDVASRTPSFDVKTNIWEPVALFGSGRFGAGADFRLTDAVKLNLEVGSALYPDRFNSKLVGNTDWQIEAKLGLVFNIGMKKNKKAAPAPVAAPAPAPKPAPAPAPKPEPKPEPKAEPAPAPAPAKTSEPVKFELVETNVFFDIDKYVINPSEKAKLDEIVPVLKQCKGDVLVTGYADVDTGTSTRNMFLSEKRAAVVAEYLVSCGIAKERIVTDHKGSTVQPFKTAEENRVAIVKIK